MRNRIIVSIFVIALATINANAQPSYEASIGLAIDFGTGTTLVGPSGKYFFANKQAVVAEVVFGSGVTGVTALYEFHGTLSEEDNLKWFFGGGPSVAFREGIVSFAARPTIGFDYKVVTMPLNFSFDWRPAIVISNDGAFEAARFCIGARYVID